jgi:oligopeptide transport system substrate-binding protein
VLDRTRLLASPTYWGRDEVALGSLDAYAAEGATTQLNLYLTGAVDWIVKPPPQLLDELAGRPDLLTGGQFGTSFLRFNTTRPPFDDPRVRRALTLALDRQTLARDVLRGGQRAASSFVPPGAPGYDPAPLPPPDPERAAALLAAAGFPGGTGFPAFELLHPHNDSARDFCEAVAEQWRATLGVRARLVTEPWKVYLDSCTRLLYDTAFGTWIGDVLEAGPFLEIFRSGSANNRTGWSSPAYDGWLARARAATDPAERAGLLRRAEMVLLQELPVAPVYQRVNINLLSPRVEGFADNPLDVHPLRDLSLRGPAP